MSETPLWDRLAGAAYRAGQQGDWKKAAELGEDARAAWLSHCEAVNGQQAAQSHAEDNRKAVADWEYEEQHRRTRGW